MGICAGLCMFCVTAAALELVAQKSDTFIFEALPEGEFSKSDFLAMAHIRGERAISYLPFTFRAFDMGIVPERHDIGTAKFEIFIKSIPLFPDTNANASKKGKEKKDTESEGEKEPEADLEDAALATAVYAAEKADSETDDTIRIELWGICDMETFFPNSKDFRISWDGDNDSPAPKFLDGDIDTHGMMKLGVIELKADEERKDGELVEFTSMELEDFVKFAFGLAPAKNVETPLKSLEHTAIVMRQISGPSGVIFYSADSIGEKTDKAQSGEEADPKTGLEPESPLPETDEALEGLDGEKERKDMRPKIIFELSEKLKKPEQSPE